MPEPALAPVPATPDDLFRRLEELGIASQTVRHAAVFTVEEAQKHRGEIAGGHCKNLFLKDKAGQLWLVVMLESSRLDMKAAQGKLGSARLSFASPDLMRSVLGVDPGSVTPFTVINKSALQVQVVLEAAMMREARLSYHPLTNTATTTIASADLVAFLRAQGHEPLIIDFAP
ncbi:MAG: DNA-binding protein [Rhodospirillales bacterium]|jgi:Ala-tRNA(Pro) deacylase|nr:DNA-binding protein [Rhodospirillales bacterium]